MGDQRRRSKSKGCQKEQEEGEEEEVCGQAYTEWAWPLLTVHSGGRAEEGEGGRREKQVQGQRTTGIGVGQVQGTSKGDGAKKKQKEEMADEMCGKGTEKMWKRQEGRKGGREW